MAELITRRRVLLFLGGWLAAIVQRVSSSPAQSNRVLRTVEAFGPGATRQGGEVDFNAVVPGDHVANACTPETPADFVGIRIVAPAAVKSGVDQFVVCGTFRFPAEYVYRLGTIHHAVVLVAVGAKSHRPAACNLRTPGATDDPEETGSVEDPAWMENHFIKLYFNVSLRRYMTDFPGLSDDYFVYALLEDHVSNVVRVSFEA